MQVKLDVSPDTNVTVEQDDEGNVISIVFTPLFATRNAQAVLAYGICTSDTNKRLDRFSLIVSGSNGRVVKKSRIGAVKAAVDMTDEESSGQADDEEEGNE